MTRDPAADAASRLPRTASPAEPTAPAADAAAPPRPEPAADAGTRQSPAATPASPITSPGTPLTYAAAGVDTDAGDRAVDLMKSALERGAGPRAIGGVGGFAGLFDARELTSYRHPLLASSTDGVGTKVAIAQAMDIHHTIGIDLVAMVVDDLVVCGATPLVMTDYIATGHVVPERIAAIVMGIAEGCVRTGTALVGGETAEHPGLLGPDEYDVAGAAVGVVEADAVLGPDRVRPGDAVIGIAASGLHSNGYSLVRAIVARTGWAWDREVAEFGRTLGEEVLEPTALYTRACLDLVARLGSAVHAFAHVTGGGLAANLARVLPEGTDAIVRRDAWEVPPVFPVLRELGGVPWRDAERTWNLGIGMVAVVEAAAAADAVAHLTAAGHPAYVIGQTEAAGPAAGPSGARSAGVAAGASGAEASGARSQGAAVHGARVLREQADGAKDQSTKGQGAKGQGAGAQSTRVQGTRVQGTKGIQGGAVTLEGTYRV